MAVLTQTGKITDIDLQRKVLEELRWDVRIDESGIGVAADDAVVTLTGTVRTYAEKVAAEKAAHRVRGVLDVANEIRVNPSGSAARLDTDIAHAVRTALEWDVQVPQERIHTTVSDGVVTLSGEVPYWYQHLAAERAVGNLAGVRTVINNIVVVPPAPPARADTIRAEIESALERHAEHVAERTARRIGIQVSDGTASLSGTVHNWVERQAVLDAARHTAGVHDVEDHLRIDPTD